MAYFVCSTSNYIVLWLGWPVLVESYTISDILGSCHSSTLIDSLVVQH